MFDIVLLIQVSFLLFLPCLLVVAVWLGNKAILLLDAHLQRFQGMFVLVNEQQKENSDLLVAILQKVILQAAVRK